jgi:hypothetical protein
MGRYAGPHLRWDIRLKGAEVYPRSLFQVMKGAAQQSNSGIPSKLFDLISFLLQELDNPFFPYQMPRPNDDKIGSGCL